MEMIRGQTTMAVTPVGGLLLIVIVVGGLWIAPILFAKNITLGKGRGGTTGILLGVFLGWLGVLIASLLSSERSVTASLQKTSGYRECPHCKEAMRRDASACPHCRNYSHPWVYHRHLWWYSAADGSWYWLNGPETEWVASNRDEDEIGPPTVAAMPVEGSVPESGLAIRA